MTAVSIQDHAGIGRHGGRVLSCGRCLWRGLTQTSSRRSVPLRRFRVLSDYDRFPCLPDSCEFLVSGRPV